MSCIVAVTERKAGKEIRIVMRACGEVIGSRMNRLIAHEPSTLVEASDHRSRFSVLHRQGLRAVSGNRFSSVNASGAKP